MKGCEQASGMTIYDHGLAVANRYRDLYTILGLYAVPGSYEWHIPDDAFLQLQELRKLALTPQQARIYHVFHDCSKPSCRVIIDGKVHYPDHALKSAELFKMALPDDQTSYELILHDMDCHTFRGEQLQSICENKHGSTLLLTAWAEIHANASALFGGYESDSFKIKRKQLMKLTKRMTVSL